MSEPVRNVLFLVADEWRGDTLGLLGASGVRTPNLDRLAAESVTFTNHWCQGSPCGPSRRTLLTGTATATHGQWTNHTIAGDGLPTLAGEVARAGVRPLLVGYTDTPTPGWDPDADPDEQARDLYDPAFELIRPFFWQLGFPAYRRYLDSLGSSLGLGSLDPSMMGIYPQAGEPDPAGLAPSRVPAGHSDTAWLTDAALDVLDESTEPMLLHVNWLRPHPPLVPSDPYHRLVDPDEVAPPDRASTLDELVEAHPFFATAAAGRPMGEYLQERRRVESVTEADDRRLRAAYYGLCAEVDHHVGRLLDRLRATGRWDDTLIVFLSDHGDALGDHRLYGRRGPFDGHGLVPCIIRDPRPSADPSRGARYDRFTGNADIMPTILDALGLAVPPTVEGSSLLPVIEGGAVGAPGRDIHSHRDHVRFEMDWSDHGPSRTSGAGPDRFVMVRTDRHRYVDFDRLPSMLFDLAEDPGERRNRSGDPALADVEDEMRRLARRR